MKVKGKVKYKTMNSDACYMGKVYANEGCGDVPYYVCRSHESGYLCFLMVNLKTGYWYKLEDLVREGWYEIEAELQL